MPWLAAMADVAWDDYVLAMMRSPEERHEVIIGPPPGAGLSPNNPYLQSAHMKPTRTYTESIDPAKVARQILEIREMIACEWAEDLQLLQADNAELRRHRADEVKSDEGVDALERFQHAIIPAETVGDSGIDCTPLRQPSYDLLKNAATAEALRRLLTELEGDPKQQHVSMWLSDFIATHAAALTDAEAARARAHTREGRGGWHVARDVILRLMSQPVSVAVGTNGEAHFLDPLALAESTMTYRAQIATEWSEMMRRVPDGHLALERRRLSDRLSGLGGGDASGDASTDASNGTRDGGDGGAVGCEGRAAALKKAGKVARERRARMAAEFDKCWAQIERKRASKAAKVSMAKKAVRGGAPMLAAPCGEDTCEGLVVSTGELFGVPPPGFEWGEVF